MSELYQVHLAKFEGPFDLLLFFIERDELDIYDIPIATITHDFIDYLHKLEKAQLEIAADFLVMAARLMRIKAQMLLPRPLVNDVGEIVDPRTELVQNLLEFRKYKSIVNSFQELEQLRNQLVSRGFVAQEARLVLHQFEPKDELLGLNLYQLLRVYKQVISARAIQARKPRHVIKRYPYDIDQVKRLVQELAIDSEKTSFTEIISIHPNRVFMVFVLMAILELVQEKKLRTVIHTYNHIEIYPVLASLLETTPAIITEEKMVVIE